MEIIENKLLNMSSVEYHAGLGLSSTGLKKILKAPSFYHVPIPDSPAFLLGRATHTAILEPEKFSKKYTVAPDCDKRTKAGKALWAEFQAANEGKELLKEEQFNQINAMGLAVMDHPAASLLLSGGQAEKSLFWTEPTTEVLMKIRPDYLQMDKKLHTIIDLKTCLDASQEGFSKAVSNLGYHISAVMYCMVCQQVFGVPTRFIWVAVEKFPPYNVAVYTPDSSGIMMKVGQAKVWEGIHTYKFCQENKVWPGYSDGIEKISLPGWVK